MSFLRRKRQITIEQTSTSEPANQNDKIKTRSHKSTLKQEKFIENFIRHGNASRAAREAGYSPRSAAVIASRNLNRKDIQERIKSRIDDAKVETDEIIGTLVSHMRADICDLIDDDGALDLVRAIETGATHIIKKLVVRTRRRAGTGGSPTVKEGVASDPTTDSPATDDAAGN